MPTIVTRSGKGAPLTNTELDANFTNLNTYVDASARPAIRPSLLLDFANSKTLDPRITFSRASSATRTNSQGLIESVPAGVPRFDHDPITLACKGLFVEEQRTNLLTYSGQFDNAVWQKQDVTITPNSAIAPDGTNTAATLVEGTGASSIHRIYYSGITVSAGTYTASIFLKKKDFDWAQIRVYDAGMDRWVNVNVSSGEIGYSSNITSVNAFALNGGWYRVAVTCPASAQSTYQVQVWSSRTTGNINGFPNYTGDGTSGIYIWGAQLEAGSFPTSYIPSTDTFTSRASTATFIGSNGLIQTAAANVARYQYNPNNLSIAPKLLLEGASTNLLLNSLIDGTSLAAQSVSVTAQSYTLSFYGTGTVTLSGASTATVVGSGAYPLRTTLVFTPSAGTLTLTVTGTVQYAQLEAGSYPTSYIPTTSAQVTRTADVSSSAQTTRVIGTADLPSKIRTKGTIVIEHNAPSGRVLLGDGNNSVITSTGPGKVAIAFDSTGVRTSVNGAAVTTSAAITLGSVLRLGGNTTSRTNAHISRYAEYDTTVTNTELQALSS